MSSCVVIESKTRETVTYAGLLAPIFCIHSILQHSTTDSQNRWAAFWMEKKRAIKVRCQGVSVFRHNEHPLHSVSAADWKSFSLNVTNEKQMLSFNTGAHCKKPGMMLQATKGSSSCVRHQARCFNIQMHSVITLTGRFRGTYDK